MEETQQRVLVLIDGDGLYRAGKQKGIQIEFESVRELMVEDDFAWRSIYYAVCGPAGVTVSLGRFFDVMRDRGFRVTAKQFTDGCCDVIPEMTVDIVSLIDSVDVVAVATHSDGMAAAMEYAASRGKQVVLACFRDNLRSTRLVGACDYLVDLSEPENIRQITRVVERRAAALVDQPDGFDERREPDDVLGQSESSKVPV